MAAMQAAGEDTSGARLTPWVYQLELLDMAKDRNVVAFLDTGSGKTFISVLLLKHRLEAHALQAAADAEGRPCAPGPRWLAVFLAPKVALVQQQAEVLRRSLPVRVRAYVGSEVEAWWRSPSRWRTELEEVDLAVMTPQILQDLLTHGILPSITDLDTICFDEAHHCTGKHPYAMIMQFYHAAKGRRPRIFGMSAAPVSAGKKLSAYTLRKNIAELERNLDARIVTVVDRGPVEEVAPPPTLNVVYYPPLSWPQRVAALEEQLQKAQERVNLAVASSEGEWRRELQEAVGFAGVSADAHMVIFEPGAPAFKASKLKEMLGAVMHVMQNLGPYCAALCALDAMAWLVAGAPEGERCYGASGAWRSGGGGAESGGANRGSAAAGLAWEVTQEQHAVNMSSAQLLHAFADLILPARERPPALDAALAAVDLALGAKQPLRRLPVAVLQQILDSVTPRALQQSLEHTLRSTVGGAGASGVGDLPELPLLSAKAAVLVRSLQAYRQFAAERNWTAIVFVQQRMTALALHRLLAAVPSTSDWIRSSPFMAQGTSIGSHNFVPKEQSDILKRFKLGEINLLVSTAVAEEGIDVKSCQLVVRFDLPPNAQSFLQSRGRARMKNSHLVVLVESGDEAQEALVQRMADFEVAMRAQALANVAVLQEGDDAESEAGSDTEEEEGQARDGGGEEGEGGGAFEYRVPATGARVTLQTSLALLQRYTSKLPADRFMVLRPAYRIELLNSGRALAHVQLPSASPLLTAKGHAVAGKRRSAKASAALEACRRLHQLGALNDHLLPAVLYKGEDVGDAIVQASVANERLQAMDLDATPPAALSRQICAAPGGGATALHCYTWQSGDPSSALNAASGQRIGLLLPAPLESVAEMPRCHLDGASDVELVYSGERSVHSAELAALLECSALLRRHAGGHCGSSGGAHNYALVPLAAFAAAAEGDASTSAWALDWATVHEICSLAAAQAAGLTALDLIAQSGGSTGRLEGKVLLTLYNKMQYLYRGVAEGMDVNSTFQRSARGFPASESTAAAPSSLAEGGSCTYADYYRLRWGKSGLDAAQPLLVATRAPNSHFKAADLAPAHPEEDVRLVPELCAVHAVPAVLWPAVSATQSLLWQLEGTLAAQELQRELQAAGEDAAWRGPPLGLLRCAITARSALDAAGDYESLETLGDAFLKYAVSATLFVQHRHYHEGQLTALKMRVISNAALLRVGLGLGLDRRVRVAPMTEEGFDGGGDVAKRVVSRNSKVLADAVEALIGAFWAGAGEAAALALLRHLALVQPFELPPVQELAPLQGGGEVQADLRPVEAELGYTFKAKWLGQEALTHGSCLGSRCYQRLEFLGDAVLDAGLTRHFYSLAPRCTPGELHNVRSAAVNSERLALAAVGHGLHAHVRHQSPALFATVDDFTAEVERRVAELRAGERSSVHAWHRLLRDNAFGLDTAAAPKVLSDIVESLVGAVWVDSGGSLDAAWGAAERLLQPLPAMGAGAPINPLRRLREMEAQAGTALAFEVVQEGGGEGGVVIRVLGDGALLGQGVAGHSRTAASRLAAQAVLAAWDGSAAGARGGKRPKVAR